MTEVTVPIREGKAGEGPSSIVAEGDIDVKRELKREGEDHVPQNRPQSWDLA